MNEALEQAKKGWGKTNPNPLVGAVIVKNDEIIAKGNHEICGGHHAEACAINSTAKDISGATMYVNLEPCSHQGKTPPCVDEIIKAGIKEVVIGMVDPNPLVSGRGIKILEQAGIIVRKGVLEKQCIRLNEIFIKYIVKKKPFVIMKSAMTLDGKIASCEGDSKWITGEKSREFVHRIRSRVSSVMVGKNTVIKDNPYLTVRLGDENHKDPVRIVIDSKGMIPLNSSVFNQQSKTGVIIATTIDIPPEREEAFINKGAKVIKTRNSGHVNLNELMNKLYELEIDSVLLEGGGKLNANALNAGIVDKLMLFFAPKIIGGQTALTAVEGEGIKCLSDCLKVKDIEVTRFDEDILIEGYL